MCHLYTNFMSRRTYDVLSRGSAPAQKSNKQTFFEKGCMRYGMRNNAEENSAHAFKKCAAERNHFLMKGGTRWIAIDHAEILVIFVSKC